MLTFMSKATLFVVNLLCFGSFVAVQLQPSIRQAAIRLVLDKPPAKEPWVMHIINQVIKQLKMPSILVVRQSKELNQLMAVAEEIATQLPWELATELVQLQARHLLVQRFIKEIVDSIQ